MPSDSGPSWESAAGGSGAGEIEAILLVGGQGTRLRPLTIATPKPLLPTAGVPFLAHHARPGGGGGDHPGDTGHRVPGGHVRHAARRRVTVRAPA